MIIFVLMYLIEGLLILSLFEMMTKEPLSYDDKKRIEGYLMCSIVWPIVLAMLIICAICSVPFLFMELSDYVITKKEEN